MRRLELKLTRKYLPLFGFLIMANPCLGLTDAGTLLLDEGGGRMFIDGQEHSASAMALSGEYPRLYARMAELLATGACDTDFEPMRHVADAFLLGHRKIVDPFYD